MRHKKQIIRFLEDNSVMINSLLSEEERIMFLGDIVSEIAKDIKRKASESEKKDLAAT